jgi:hypothetical protein
MMMLIHVFRVCLICAGRILACTAKFEAQKRCLDANQQFLSTIVAHAGSFTANSHLLQGTSTSFKHITGEGQFPENPTSCCRAS